VANRLPDYDFFAVPGRGAGADGRGSGSGDAAAVGAADASQVDEGEVLGPGVVPEVDDVESERELPSDGEAETDERLFPPGPLARVEVHPGKLRIPPLATRGLKARALDADRRPCSGDVGFSWHLGGPGELQADSARARYTAPDLDAIGSGDPLLRVTALQGETQVSAEVPIHFQRGAAGDARTSGIPEPHPVNAPGEGWRSRLLNGRWEYNADHRDYLEASETEARRLRYLVNLFAKEIVLRNFGGPGDGDVLERMVEVLTYLDKGAK